MLYIFFWLIKLNPMLGFTFYTKDYLLKYINFYFLYRQLFFLHVPWSFL